MKTAASALLALLPLLAACGPKEDAAAGEGAPAMTPAEPRPETLANGEPAAVTVKHVLVAFEGSAGRSQTPRTREEAERLAYELVGRAKAGEDFDAMMRQYSSDPGPGTYSMANAGVTPQGDEAERSGMVKRFGDAAFRIRVGEVSLAEYHPDDCPFGWHVIKRVK